LVPWRVHSSGWDDERVQWQSAVELVRRPIGPKKRFDTGKLEQNCLACSRRI